MGIDTNENGSQNNFKTAQQLIEYKRAKAKRDRKFKDVPLPRYAPWPNQEEMEALERDPEIKRIFKKRKKLKINVETKENE